MNCKVDYVRLKCIRSVHRPARVVTSSYVNYRAAKGLRFSFLEALGSQFRLSKLKSDCGPECNLTVQKFPVFVNIKLVAAQAANVWRWSSIQ